MCTGLNGDIETSRLTGITQGFLKTQPANADFGHRLKEV